jgi:hypothetical protein
VLRWLFSGQLLDFGRLPVLTLLALTGVALAFWKFARLRRVAPRRTFLVCGAVVWIAFYCGRPLWGRALILAGISDHFHLHRLIGGVHVFLVLLAGTALAGLWRAVSRQMHWGVAAAATAILLYPAVAERARFLAGTYQDSREELAQFDNMRGDLDGLTALVEQRGGRVFPLDMKQNQGGIQKDTVFWIFLESRGVPMVPHVAHSMGLTADLVVTFSGEMAEDYREYNIKTFVLRGEYLNQGQPFLKRLPPIGTLQVYEAPGTGYFDVVQAPVGCATGDGAARPRG